MVRNYKYWIFAITLIGALSFYKCSQPPKTENDPTQDILNAFRDSLKAERYWNERLQTNNDELYNELVTWYDHANRMKRVLGIKEPLSYPVKCENHIDTWRLVGKNEHPRMKVYTKHPSK